MSYIDDFINRAEQDKREGNKTFQIQELAEKVWNDGRVSMNFSCTITEANGAKFYVNIPSGPEPTKEELDAIDQSGDQKKIMGTASGLRLRKQLREHYGLNDPKEIKLGDIFCGKLQKDKKSGYIRLRAFLPKGSVVSSTGTSVATSDIPF